MITHESIARLVVRLTALIIAIVCVWQLTANLATSWRDFDPNYAVYFIQFQVLRPAIGLVIALLLAVLDRPLARLLSRNCERYNEQQ